MEKEYIQYLIENKDKTSDLLDRYFTNQISFTDLIKESNNFTDIWPYKNFVKSKILDSLE